MNCIVTGASKGLGLATAKLLAQRGHNLAICSRNIVEIENAARELRTLYPVEIHACAADLSKKEEMNEVWKSWVDHSNLPTRTCVGATLTPNTEIEVTVCAVRD